MPENVFGDKCIRTNTQLKKKMEADEKNYMKTMNYIF